MIIPVCETITRNDGSQWRSAPYPNGTRGFYLTSWASLTNYVREYAFLLLREFNRIDEEYGRVR